MSVTLKLNRGALSGIPAGSAGEPLFTTDQFRLYVGSSGGNRLLGVLDKIDGTAAPTTGDDSGDGYSVGSLWCDTTNDKAYICVDSTAAAAVWQQFSGSGTGGITQLTADVTAGPGSGSVAATISANAVDFSKMQQVGTNTVLCRPAAGTGVISTVALNTSELLGRGSSGNIAAIALDSSTLFMSGNTLFGVSPASQAEQETGSVTTRYVSPARQQFHASAAKGWIRFNGTGTIAISASYNVTSITDNGTGDYTVTWATDFSSANYCVVATSAVASWVAVDGTNVPTAGATRVRNLTAGVGLEDGAMIFVSVFGDQ